ncbi:MAG: glucose-6-phosphate isomerase [bacterium]
MKKSCLKKHGTPVKTRGFSPRHIPFSMPKTPAIRKCLSELEAAGFSRRLWEKDASLWKDSPEHRNIILNSLGWLTVPEKMADRMPEIREFAEEIKKEDFTHCVLLGMGGSSLAPEVMRCVLSPKAGYPSLMVLDSTDPGWVLGVSDAIDPAKTLFIVSSKSGSTIEPNSFFKFFYDIVQKSGKKNPGGNVPLLTNRNFAAITDPGTVLAKTAEEKRFRKVFLNPSDIGGRFSALSFFGLVPAAVSGVDVQVLLDRAMRMAQACREPENNPGVALGCAMAAMAQAGRDKLTLVMPSRLESLGLWIEQLVAESTGKEGLGIVPITGEELSGPDAYGSDRFFVHICPGSFRDENTETALRMLKKNGHPVARITIKDRNDLGAEFFRWETATAAAGALLKINPFDQPNVQDSKSRTAGILKKMKKTGGPKELGTVVHTTLFDAFLSESVMLQLPGKISDPDNILRDFLSMIRKGGLCRHTRLPAAESGNGKNAEISAGLAALPIRCRDPFRVWPAISALFRAVA